MKLLTTLTGPSCAGKSTLETMLVARGCLKAVSTTTRAPRAGEQDGVDYYFVSQTKFHTLKECGMFIEHVQFGDHWYGVTTAELERLWQQGEHVILVCEPVGAKQIRAWAADRQDVQLRQVFVDNPESVINDRFLRRFYEDIRAASMLRDQTLFEKTLATYAKRLSVMQGTERTWVLEAYDCAHPDASRLSHDQKGFRYDTVIERFDEFNANEVADDLLTGMVAAS